MSYTGGYDLCIEIADRRFQDEAARMLAGLLEGLREQITLHVDRRSGSVQLRGSFHMFITGVRLHLVRAEDARVNLEISFDRSALALTSPHAESTGDLRGTFTWFSIPITLEHAEQVGAPLDFVIDLQAAERVQLWLPSPSDDRALAALLDRAGVGAAAGRDALEDAMRSYLAIVGAPRISSTIALAADGDEGQLAPLRLAAVELETRPGPVGVGGVLCVYGSVSRANVGSGDRRTKTQFAIRDGQQAALSISPPLFRDGIFRPAAFAGLLPSWLTSVLGEDFLGELGPGAFDHLTEAERSNVMRRLASGHVEQAWRAVLGAEHRASYARRLGPVVLAALPADVRGALSDTRAGAAAKLPRPAGRAAAMSLGSARMVALSATLQHGAFRIAGTVEPTPVGVEGHATFRADSQLRVTAAHALEIASDEPVTESSVHLAAWLLALGIATGPLLIVEAAINDYARQQSITETTSRVRNALRAIVAPALPDALGQLATATIVPDGVLVGFVPDPAAPAPRLPAPTLPSLDLDARRERSTGSFGPPMTARFDGRQCLHGSYSFRERDVTTMATVTARPNHLDRPVRYAWSLNDSPISGTGTLAGADPAVQVRYAVSADGTQLRIANVPGSPDVWLVARCVATDRSGVTAEAVTGRITFEGRERRYEHRYSDELARCIQGALDDLQRAPLQLGAAGLRGIFQRIAASLRSHGGTVDPSPLSNLGALALGARLRDVLAALPAVRAFR